VSTVPVFDVGEEVKAGPARLAFRFNAVCTASLTGSVDAKVFFVVAAPDGLATTSTRSVEATEDASGKSVIFISDISYPCDKCLPSSVISFMPSSVRRHILMQMESGRINL